MASPQDTYLDSEGNPLGRHTVQDDFATRDSIPAQVYDGNQRRIRPRRLKARQQEDTVPGETLSYEEGGSSYSGRGFEGEHLREALKVKEELTRRREQNIRIRGRAPKIGVGSFGRFMGIGAAWTAYSLQFFFGVISLIGIGGQAMANELVNGSFIGRAINSVTKLVGIDLATLIPFDYFGFGFWGLATMVALCSFFAFLLLFAFTHAHVFSTTGMTLITALTFACSILPVSNLFPWIPLWVMAVNARSLAHSLSPLFRG